MVFLEIVLLFWLYVEIIQGLYIIYSLLQLCGKAQLQSVIR